MTSPGDKGKKRTDLPRRLGDIITPALGRIIGGDEARAYSAWSRAVGEPVTRGTRPKAFRRGQLTVECASSVWANELTYLGPQILRRMDEVAPGHPVVRFRFVVGRLPAADGTEDDSGAAAEKAPEAFAKESGASAEKENCRQQQAAQDVADAARTQAEGVQDGRLRAAIEAALRRAAEESPEALGRGTPSG